MVQHDTRPFEMLGETVLKVIMLSDRRALIDVQSLEVRVTRDRDVSCGENGARRAEVRILYVELSH